MGAQVCRLASEDPGFLVVARVIPPGEDGGVLLSAVDGTCVDAMIDFSHLSAAAAHAKWCAQHQVALVLGTTGLSDDDQALVDTAATETTVFQASNFSVGVALLADLAARAARVLGISADVEIVESHHHHKVDAPSGTAITLGKSVAEARGQRYEEVAVDGRSGLVGARVSGEIGMHAMRLSDVVGRHAVHFGWPAEGLVLSHEAHDRAVFACGALRAAEFAHKTRANGAVGSLTMTDLLAQ
jgi:4-hydroxy-tetrahydrodipicolinate reductase